MSFTTKKNDLIFIFFFLLILLFKNNLIHFLEPFVTPLLSFYSRNIPFEKAAYTGLNFLLLYSLSIWIIYKFRNKFHDCVKQLLYDFSAPINLSIFRILTFTLAFTFFDFNHLISLVSLPRDSLVPPMGMGFILNFLPPNEKVIWALSILFVPSTILSILGFKTRISTLVSTLSAIYLLGIPNFYGKVNHYNYQIWFMMILTISPCSDAISLDSLLSKTKNTISKNFNYSIPVLAIWFVFGMMYFFPGAWKICYSGIEWFTSENLRYTLIEKYLESGFTPFFQIEIYPMVYKATGLFTILFEIIFIFLIFIPKWRLISILMAASFHIGVYFQMGINFLELLPYFIIFINWGRLFKGSKITITEDKIILRRPIIILLTSIFLFGSLGIVHGWPFSCYPAFATIKTNIHTSVEVTKVMDERETQLVLENVKKKIGPERLWVLMDSRNKKFNQNLGKLELLIRDIDHIKNEEIRFYLVKKDLTHYPQVKEINREKILFF